MSKGLRVIKENGNLAVWSKQVEDCRSSGLSVTAWCRENSIAVSTFHYRQQKVFNALQKSISFVEAPVLLGECCNIQTVATVHIGNARAEVHSGADETTLSALFKVLKSC